MRSELVENVVHDDWLAKQIMNIFTFASKVPYCVL